MMDIGGYDFIIPGPCGPNDIDVFLRGVRARWPDAIVERVGDDADEKTITIANAIRLQLHPSCVLFVFENPAAMDSWNEHGLTKENDEQLLHGYFYPDEVTFVANTKDGPSGQFIQDMIQSIQLNRQTFGGKP
jgi:hypothetical protein